MGRRREPDRETLPPPEIERAELQQSKNFEDRVQTEPPAVDYFMNADGSADNKQNAPGDKTPANDTHW